MKKNSIVIPVFNEAESLEQLHDEIAQIATQAELNVEIVFVDDGSTDASWSQIERLASQDARVRGIRFRRNFGKAAALSAGIKSSSGEIIITMDADLQDDPKEIPSMLAKMDEGFEVVSGWKKIRHDPWHKTMPSKVFNFLVGFLTGVRLHDHNCGFKCYRREVFDDVELYGERHRFIPVLAAAYGWQVGEQIVEHRARQHGQSKYGFKRFITGSLDLMTVYFLTGFQNRPQHLLGTIGLIFFLLGGLGLGYLAVYWLVRMVFDPEGWLPLHQRPLVIYSLGALLVGAQLMSIGFLAELITAGQRADKKTYAIKSTTNLPATDSSTPDISAVSAGTGEDVQQESLFSNAENREDSD